jgi:hypothetical protein
MLQASSYKLQAAGLTFIIKRFAYCQLPIANCQLATDFKRKSI